jgi:hypothetical protein
MNINVDTRYISRNIWLYKNVIQTNKFIIPLVDRYDYIYIIITITIQGTLR